MQKTADKNLKQYYEKIKDLKEMTFREVKETKSEYL